MPLAKNSANGRDDVPSSAGLHHHLSSPLAKCTREMVFVVPRDDVVKPWLPTKLVYPLGNLVSCCIPKTREQGEKFATNRCCGVVTEDDAIQR